MQSTAPNYDRVSFAPMLDVTNTFQRYMMRCLTKKTTLYTEMYVAETILFSRYTDDIIDFDPSEHPIVGQLGGNNPEYLAKAGKILEEKGYDEINVNCGCPSNTVSTHSFGACLMLEPEKVRDIITEMKKTISIPITVKCRIGVDHHDSYEELCHFISIVSGSSSVDEADESETITEPLVSHFIIHARKCILKGLSTRENRRIPELNYDWVFRLLDSFPHIDFTINGGIKSYNEMLSLLNRESPVLKRKLRGVMVGRMIMQHPWLCRHIDDCFYDASGPHLTRREIVMKYVNYVEQFTSTHHHWIPPVATIYKPLTTLFNGVLRGGSVFRRVLQEKLCIQKKPFRQAVEESLRCFDDELLDSSDSFEHNELDDYCVVIE